MGRSPSGSKAMDGRESQARSARGEGAAGACCAGAHPLPNPSPIEGEGLKRMTAKAGAQPYAERAPAFAHCQQYSVMRAPPPSLSPISRQ